MAVAWLRILEFMQAIEFALFRQPTAAASQVTYREQALAMVAASGLVQQLNGHPLAVRPQKLRSKDGRVPLVQA